MSQSIPTGTPPPRRRRRWPWVLAFVVLLPVLLVGSLPWLLNTPAGNRLVAGPVGRAFAPGFVRFRTIRFSWTRPTRLTDVVLEDPAGKAVVRSPSASLSSSLWGLIVRPDRPGTLSLETAAFDVERHADGSIDLFQALEGILASRDPLRDLTIRADSAMLHVGAPALAAPVAAVPMDLLIELRPSPARDAWSVSLRKAAGTELHARGEVDRWHEGHDLDLEFRVMHWPLATRRGSIETSMNLDGDFTVRRVAGRWTSQGRLRADDLHLAGAALRGEAIDLTDLAAEWAIARGETGVWSVERFDALGSFGHLSAVVPDLSDPTRPARIEGQLDLAALSRRVRPALRRDDLGEIESGTARLLVTSGQGADRTQWTLDATLADLAWKDRDGGRRTEVAAVSLKGRASYRPEIDGVDVAELSVASGFGGLHASGRIGDLDGPVSVDLAGTIDPAWDVLSKYLSEHVEPSARLAGEPGSFRLKGPIGSDALEVELGLKLSGADVFGMRLGPTPIMVQSRGGQVVVQPIETTLNGGRLHVEPLVDTAARGGTVVRLDSKSTLADAAVNEEVSRRVLSYVAPVLDQTTRASGRVSVAIEDAAFPVGGDPNRRANVTGRVTFQDVAFAPGPLTREILAMVAPRKEPGIVRLDQPVFLSIADGRVNQRGLAIPIGDVTRVEMEGWVDFDKHLGLVATLPITPAMFGDSPVFGAIVAGTNVRVPIGGTLDSPKLDKEAFKAGLRELGKTLLVRGAGVGALELLDRLSRPRDPNAPPPPTPEERKAQRLERRNERRRARGLEPLPAPDQRP